MKHTTLYGWLTLVILCTILSCTDHRDLPPVARFRVKTIKSSEIGFTHVLTYDNLGRLASYTGPISDSFASGDTFYDYGGYPQADSKYDFFTTRYTKKQGQGGIIIFYNFDNQRRLIQVRYLDLKAGTVLTYKYVYTDNNTFPSSRIVTRFLDNGSIAVGSRTEAYSFVGGNATIADGKIIYI